MSRPSPELEDFPDSLFKEKEKFKVQRKALFYFLVNYSVHYFRYPLCIVRVDTTTEKPIKNRLAAPPGEAHSWWALAGVQG